VRPQEQAVIEQPAEPAPRAATDDASAARATAPDGPVDEFGGLGASDAPTPTPVQKREETVAAAPTEPVAIPARTEATSPPHAAAETHETVAPAVVAAPEPRRTIAEAPQVVAAELPSAPPVPTVPTVVEPVREEVQIAAASPSAQEIAEEEQAAAELAASPAIAASSVIEQAPLAAPEPRVVATEPAFLAAERAQAEERRRRQLAQIAVVNAQPVDDQPAVTARPNSVGPNSGGIEVADLRRATEPQTSNREAESIQLAAARRISELTTNEAAANGAVRSFPVPPPIPQGAQTAALDRTGGYVPQVFGASNGDSRVVIEAKLESWVQVRGRSGETLLTRILRVGDKYLVPNRANLVMMTGNAGALKIFVDGKEIGPLGPPGAVLRDVSLEPSQLLARAASQ
jgi:hypothetical protein